MLKTIWLRILKRLIGKTSVIANITIYDGSALLGSGLAHNVLFTHGEPPQALVDATHNGCLIFFKHSRGIVTDTVFASRSIYLDQYSGDDTGDALTWATAKKTDAAIEQIARHGDIVWVAPPPGSELITLREVVTTSGN